MLFVKPNVTKFISYFPFLGVEEEGGSGFSNSVCIINFVNTKMVIFFDTAQMFVFPQALSYLEC
jgi:hypothetical protein